MLPVADETGRFADVTQRQVSEVRTLSDLAVVIGRLRDDWRGTGRTEWENATLDRFLGALAAVAEDRDGHEKPTWATMADLLVTATGYE